MVDILCKTFQVLASRRISENTHFISRREGNLPDAAGDQRVLIFFGKLRWTWKPVAQLAGLDMERLTAACGKIGPGMAKEETRIRETVCAFSSFASKNPALCLNAGVGLLDTSSSRSVFPVLFLTGSSVTCAIHRRSAGSSAPALHSMADQSISPDRLRSS